jgi:hypothetical protein
LKENEKMLKIERFSLSNAVENLTEVSFMDAACYGRENFTSFPLLRGEERFTVIV